MKRILSLVLALILCTSLAVPALAADFSDVPPSHNFYPAVADCSSKGIVGGYPDGTFRPSATVTRSNFCVMLSRAFYPSDITRYTNDFTTSFGSFYPNYLALANNGIWNNVSFDEEYIYTSDFAASMNLGISRYDMAQLMTNIMNARGFAAGEAEKNAAASKITDYSSIPGQYREAVANVYALGVIGGYSDGSFNGGGIMNRGQAAAVIYRMTQAVPVAPPRAGNPRCPGTGDTGSPRAGNAQHSCGRHSDQRQAHYGRERDGTHERAADSVSCKNRHRKIQRTCYYSPNYHQIQRRRWQTCQHQNRLWRMGRSRIRLYLRPRRHLPESQL
ncbi:S-layer homology domain-containing protein [uncultured Oscillibacter sp.]|uniref:S-layer homology domain-containing protein n=1 Tax=uncultured Oscillibacter sp. TaxID=876091 RepID=UPI00260CA4BA|nr:S-layer homology domain-containing protein [uncultured Oscillibacter sp.]